MNGQLYGLLAEFESPDELVEATRKAREAGYRRLDAHTPFPVEGLSDALGFRHTGLPLVVLIGGVVGCLAGFGLQYWVSVIEYPLNIGGRPLNSWPSFVPVTFEMTVLVAALSAVLGMLGLNRLPQPWHPLFDVPGFEHATRDAFFLCIHATDPQFHRDTTRQFLQTLGATSIHEVLLEPAA
jgi:hypothetical protein